MNNPTDETIKKDVLQSPAHSHLSSEEVAKAIARHNREHPAMKMGSGKPQKKSNNR